MGDPEQPAQESVVPVTRQIVDGLEPHLLENLLCILVLVRHAQDEPEKGTAITLDQFAERFRVALAIAFDLFRVGYRLHRVHIPDSPESCYI